MLRISWQITLLALVLLPIFVLPARRMGSTPGGAQTRGGQPQRDDEHTDDRALFGAGRDAREALRTPSRRVGRVREARQSGARHRRALDDAAGGVHHRADIWSRRWRWRWSTGWAAYYALRARLRPARVVSLALLLTRLYAPLTALANARIEVMARW